MTRIFVTHASLNSSLLANNLPYFFLNCRGQSETRSESDHLRQYVPQRPWALSTAVSLAGGISLFELSKFPPAQSKPKNSGSWVLQNYPVSKGTGRGPRPRAVGAGDRL